MKSSMKKIDCWSNVWDFEDSCEVKKENIVAYFNDRKENEVIYIREGLND